VPPEVFFPHRGASQYNIKNVKALRHHPVHLILGKVVCDNGWVILQDNVVEGNDGNG